MRNISFSLTERQFLDGTKTVTRRLGWRFLKQGDHLRAVRKGMGLKKGEHPVVLGVIEVLKKNREPLSVISRADVVREGFPELTPEGFVEMFSREMGCTCTRMVTRIEFRKLDQKPEAE